MVLTDRRVAIFGLCSIIFSMNSCQILWQKLLVSNVPPARKHSAAAFDPRKNFLIIFGGRAKDNIDLNDTWILNVASGQWIDATRNVAPDTRHGSSSGFYGGLFYIFGGCSKQRCYNDLWSFDSGSFTWTKITYNPLVIPKERGFSAFGLYPESDTLVVSGGVDINNGFLGDTLRFDIILNRWFIVESWESPYNPSAPHPRGYHASMMISKTKLLIMGGCLRHGHCPSPDSWILDLRNKLWSSLPLCYYSNSYASLGLLRNELYANDFAILFGGKTRSRQIIGVMDDAQNQEVAVFDIRKNQWSIRKTEGQLPSQRFGAVFVPGNNGLYLFGGEISNGTLMTDVYFLSGNASGADIMRSCKTSFFTLISLHGLFMFLAFAVFLQIGAALAQYGSINCLHSGKINWRYMHKFLQSSNLFTLFLRVVEGEKNKTNCEFSDSINNTGLLIAGCLFGFCGFVCGFAVIINQAHFQSVHGGFGLFIGILLSCQIFLGFMSSKFTALRIILLGIHYWNGVFILLAAFINISLGLFLASAQFVLWLLWFVYIFLILFCICLVHSGIFVEKPSASSESNKNKF